MAHSGGLSSIHVNQIPLYHKYLKEYRNRFEKTFKKEQRHVGSCRYDNVTKEESDIFSSHALRVSSFYKDLNSFSKYSVLQLALDGFFNTQTGKEIKCFSCGLLYHINIEPDSPFDTHRSNTLCEHLRGTDARNVTFGNAKLGTSASLEFTNSRPERSDSFADVDIVSQPMLINGRASSRDETTVPNRGQRNPSSDSVSPRNETQATRTRRNIHREVAIVDYRLELCRLHSFKNWPSNAAVKPDDLANAGFYYLGNDDRVQCIFCRGILRSWEPEDKPLAEHLRHFPQCPYLSDPSSVGNVPLGEEDESVFSSIQFREGRDLPETLGSTPGVHLERPAHSKYAQIGERLKTFRDFPSNAFQKAEELVRAGFYYTGQIDAVRCFFCDVQLKNWKPDDDPWVEHVKASRNCGYIKMSKGEKFIEEVLKKNRNPDKKNDAKKKLRKKALSGTKHKVRTQDVERIMASSIVMSVLDMDLAGEDTMKKVVQQRLQQLGTEFPNAESLIEAVTEYIERDTSSDSSESYSSSEELGLSASKKTVPTRPPQARVAELPDDAESLQSMNQQLTEERQCKVCLDEPATIVFLRCGHLVCCSNCAPAMTRCPVCRENIVGTIRADI